MNFFNLRNGFDFKRLAAKKSYGYHGTIFQ